MTSEGYKFDPTILRAYDIRGQVGSTLSEKDSFAIGNIFASFFPASNTPPRIAVGRDGRLTSPALASALSEGLVAAGCYVIDIGVGPTPMLYFADRILKCDGAIQITGSHNPPDYNGFKMVRGHHSFFGDDITELGIRAVAGLTKVSGGHYEEQSVFDSYIERLTKQANFGDLSIVWDAGNGAAGPATEAMLSVLSHQAKLSGNHKALFCDIDGHFPNHHPNPVDPETLESLRQNVKALNADLGIGFDGDGDRIGLVDAKGRQIAGDILTAFLATDILTRTPGADILFDVKSSALALQIVRDAGGQPHLWKTGHSHMKKRLYETGAYLAGEMSGHIFIAEGDYGFDDALYVASRLVTQIANQTAETGTTITDFMDNLPGTFNTPECRIDCPDTEKFTIMTKLSEAVSASYDTDAVNLIDGVRVTVDDGWWLIRASNTEAALVARAEGKNAQACDNFVSDIIRFLSSVGLQWDGP